MKVRKTPMRTCVVTREVKPKKDLIRIVATKQGAVSVDLKGKAPGRGAYLTLAKKVIEKAKASKALDKKLKVEVPLEIYQQLLELLESAK
ncbi:MAG: YlxR family protein [Acholeplasmataceae bacterium]|jgi:predicted RNA-binding protein YlxR (DUF448 family)|nr:YlxR family protein [Acholeplasmataceae bacterium]